MGRVGNRGGVVGVEGSENGNCRVVRGGGTMVFVSFYAYWHWIIAGFLSPNQWMILDCSSLPGVIGGLGFLLGHLPGDPGGLQFEGWPLPGLD